MSKHTTIQPVRIKGTFEAYDDFFVDSGQYMICDVANLSRFDARDQLKELRQPFHASGVMIDKVYLKNWNKKIEPYDKSLNELRAENLLEIVIESPLPDAFSYAGACAQTLYTDGLAGALACDGEIVAFAFGTAHGDGAYAVWRTHEGDIVIDTDGDAIDFDLGEIDVEIGARHMGCVKTVRGLTIVDPCYLLSAFDGGVTVDGEGSFDVYSLVDDGGNTFGAYLRKKNGA